MKIVPNKKSLICSLVLSSSILASTAHAAVGRPEKETKGVSEPASQESFVVQRCDITCLSTCGITNKCG